MAGSIRLRGELRHLFLGRLAHGLLYKVAWKFLQATCLIAGLARLHSGVSIPLLLGLLSLDRCNASFITMELLQMAPVFNLLEPQSWDMPLSAACLHSTTPTCN